MSDLYIQEPPTSGRVLLKTSKGDISIELWSRECPKACRNFVQLCMEGYYNGCIFHRIIKDFIVQSGDPTGLGTGGESIYGVPFVDEFNSRLKFRYRGLLGMANAGARNTNGSQFFITLTPQDALNGKNTLFGKIVGQSIYTVNEISSVAVNDTRPLSDRPPKIISCQVIDNPFPDIVVRPVVESHVPVTFIPRKITSRRTGLLSFEQPDEPTEVLPDILHENSSLVYHSPRNASPPVSALPIQLVSQSVQDELAALEAQLFPISPKKSVDRPSLLNNLREKYLVKEDLHLDEEEDRLTKRFKQWSVKTSEDTSNWLVGGGLKFSSK